MWLLMKKSLLFVCFICMFSVSCMSVPAKDNGMKFTGTVAVKGNEPHTYCALMVDGVEYKIVGVKEKEIRRSYQNNIITVEGVIVKERQGILPSEINVLRIIRN